MPTLAEARTFLSRYGGQGNSFVDRLNFVTARLLPECNARGTKVPARFAVYTDNDGNSVVTLPRELESILAGAWQSPTPNPVVPGTFFCGRPLPVRGDWYEFATDGPGDYVGSDYRRGFVPLNGRFTTFADWNTPMLLRVKVEVPETAGKIVIRGKLNGDQIYSQDGGNWIEGVSLVFTNSDVTTTQMFDQPPYEIVKTITKGRLRLYIVDANSVETLVGYYEPTETNPSYQRYKVPRCCVQTTTP